MTETERMFAELGIAATRHVPPGPGSLPLDDQPRFQDLVDRHALDELARSVYSLFGIPLRIFGEDGALLADATGEREVCSYVNTFDKGRADCDATVGAAKATPVAAEGDVEHACFTGAVYRIVSIDYEKRSIGKMVLGPYLPAQVQDVPRSFLALDQGVDGAKAKLLLFGLPRVKPDTVRRIVRHVRCALDLIVFSGYKTLLTSRMHLASVTESYRELEDKTSKLQEAYDKLKELDRLKSNFLGTVSHELRTPLTSIMGYSEMLREGIAGPLNEEQSEYVRTIHEKGTHLLTLIMSLLDLSKLESGTMRMTRKDFDLQSVLAEVRSTVVPAARKKSVDLVVDAPGDLPVLFGDRQRMFQVVLNLVDNAMKFTPEGGRITMAAKTVVVKLDGEDEDDSLFFARTQKRVELRIMDTGIGIPEKERDKVFDAFYQVDSSSTREYGGTGLGLAIVKRLVEAHGGTIRIEGNVPTGAVFCVSLPVGQTSASKPPAPRKASLPPPGSGASMAGTTAGVLTGLEGNGPSSSS